MFDLSISIVSYNTRDILKNCLTSIFRSTTDLTFEVFVVDNASADGSADMVARDFPQVRLLCNADNRMFSKANNQALHLAQGEFFALINPDTLIPPHTLKRMIDLMRLRPDIGILGPKIYDNQGHWQPSCARTNTWLWGLSEFLLLNAIFCRNSFFWHMHYDGKDFPQPGPHEVDNVTGACLLTRRALLQDQLGGMDENYVMYFEECDLGVQVRKHGFKVMYWPAVEVVHLIGRSTRQVSVLQVYRWTWNSQLYFYKKHYSAWTYMLFRAIALFTWPLFVLAWSARRFFHLPNRYKAPPPKLPHDSSIPERLP